MADRPAAGDYLRLLKTTVPTMAGQIGELAKAELKPAAKHGGIGAGAFGGAAVVGLTVLKFLMLTGAFALSMFYAEILGRNPLTALTFGFLTMSVIGLIIVAILALFGKLQFGKVKAPQATIAETKASLGAISTAIEAGISDASEGRMPQDAFQVTSSKLPARRPDDWADNELDV